MAFDMAVDWVVVSGLRVRFGDNWRTYHRAL